MSSFVINKFEYVKAAGLMYGIASAERYPHTWFLNNVYNWFVKAYELNVASVNEQYHDNSGVDGNSYDELFEVYKEKGRVLRCRDYHLRNIRPKLLNFFDSVLYQIENMEFNKEVSFIFYQCAKKLYKSETDDLEGWWGEVEA
jgi:hypothetical protein